MILQYIFVCYPCNSTFRLSDFFRVKALLSLARLKSCAFTGWVEAFSSLARFKPLTGRITVLPLLAGIKPYFHWPGLSFAIAGHAWMLVFLVGFDSCLYWQGSSLVCTGIVQALPPLAGLKPCRHHPDLGVAFTKKKRERERERDGAFTGRRVQAGQWRQFSKIFQSLTCSIDSENLITNWEEKNVIMHR